MKKLIVAFVLLALTVTGVILMAQTPAPGAGGAGRGAGGGGGQRPAAPPVPAATGPMLDIANNLAAAINKQDAAAINKMLADDVVYLDEDGHAPPVARWVTNLTTIPAGAPAKQIAISATHSQMWDTGGWVSFNYTLTENFKGPGQDAAAPKSVKGTASIVVKKIPSGEWKIALVHGALEQKVAGLTQ